MKILLATSFFLPTHTAGTEKRTFGYAKALLERGYEVEVLCVGKWDEGQHYWNGYSDEIYQGIPVRRINLNWQKSPNPNGYLYNNRETAQFFRQCLDEWRPDLVHITSCLTLSASIIAIAREHNLPVVLTLTDFWFICHKLSLLKYDDSLCDGITTSHDCIQCLCGDSGVYKKLKNVTSVSVATEVFNGLSKIPAINRQNGLRGMALNISQRKTYLAAMLNTANIVIAPSNHLRDVLRHSGVNKEIQVIQSGHDLSWLDENRQKKPGTRLRFGYIGQFIPTKGVHVLLKAFGGHDWQGKAELHLFGNPQTNLAYYQELQQTETLNPELVIFHEPFPPAKLHETLAGLDVLIVPSLWHENNPRVIQEAFASKTPVIASDVGGIREYVQHEVNGYLFQRGDSSDLRTQIQRIVDNPAQLKQFMPHLPVVKSMSDEMDEIEVCYQQLFSQLEARKQ